MFHRVKSEGQDSEGANQQQEKAAEEQPKKQDNPFEQTNDASSKADNEETEASTESKPSTPEKKDEETMSDQDNTAEKKENETPTTQAYQQRPAQSPVRSVSGYPGSSYPGSAAPASEASASDRRLTIGPGITMSGEIESCDYLLVEGTVEAALKGANFLEIAESGVFYGTVEINEANIAGRFEGDITVNGRLTISSGGVVTGSIAYKEIQIEAGAVIDGKLTPLAQAPAAEKKPAPKAAKPATPAPKAEKKTPEPANTDEGLFSKATAAAE